MLLDWKRRIFELYQEVRAAPAPRAGWRRWRAVRDDLFRAHPQSPLSAETRLRFKELDYFPYDSAFRVLGEIEPVDPEPAPISASGGETIVFERFGRAHFELMGEEQTLDLFWLDAYGGGVFLPFADRTGGSETYPAGRYLLDTVKGADLGNVGDRVVLDFNFAYNPSCAYDPHWVCPLAPPANRLAASHSRGRAATSSRRRKLIPRIEQVGAGQPRTRGSRNWPVGCPGRAGSCSVGSS